MTAVYIKSYGLLHNESVTASLECDINLSSYVQLSCIVGIIEVGLSCIRISPKKPWLDKNG